MSSESTRYGDQGQRPDVRRSHASATQLQQPCQWRRCVCATVNAQRARSALVWAGERTLLALAAPRPGEGGPGAGDWLAVLGLGWGGGGPDGAPAWAHTQGRPAVSPVDAFGQCHISRQAYCWWRRSTPVGLCACCQAQSVRTHGRRDAVWAVPRCAMTKLQAALHLGTQSGCFVLVQAAAVLQLHSPHMRGRWAFACRPALNSTPLLLA